MLEERFEFLAISDRILEKKGDATYMGVGAGVCPPPVELHLTLEILLATVAGPLAFRAILSHRKYTIWKL